MAPPAAAQHVSARQQSRRVCSGFLQGRPCPPLLGARRRGAHCTIACSASAFSRALARSASLRARRSASRAFSRRRRSACHCARSRSSVCAPRQCGVRQRRGTACAAPLGYAAGALRGCPHPAAKAQPAHAAGRRTTRALRPDARAAAHGAAARSRARPSAQPRASGRTRSLWCLAGPCCCRWQAAREAARAAARMQVGFIGLDLGSRGDGGAPGARPPAPAGRTAWPCGRRGRPRTRAAPPAAPTPAPPPRPPPRPAPAWQRPSCARD